jgi:hypothetical protein
MILGILKLYMQKQITEAELEATVKTELLRTLGGMHSAQLDLFKQEVASEDAWVRRWRPGIALSFAGVLLFYAVAVPVAVDWLGMPRLRVGDKLLEWIVTLLGGVLGVFTIGRTLEKIADAFKRR